jgi:nitrous oxidase accessory protein
MIGFKSCRRLTAGLISIGLTGWGVAWCATLSVSPGPNALQQALENARPGDELRVAAGRYPGPLIIQTPVTLIGTPGTIVDGQSQESVVQILAPNVTIRNMQIQGSGNDLSLHHSGILVESNAHGTVIENNRLQDNLFGIFVQGANQVRVHANHIQGRTDGHLSTLGNAIHLWNTHDTHIENNVVQGGRDGIFITTSNGNTLQNNQFQGLRFAIHYMYSHNNEVSGNLSQDNHLGYALMFSKQLRIFNNVSRRDRDHGMMLNFTNSSEIYANRVEGGAEKCLFFL